MNTKAKPTDDINLFADWPQALDPREKELHERYDPEFLSFLNRLKKANKKINQTILIKAYNTALYFHRSHKRKSGDPYFDHLFSVAQILSELHMDSTTIAAGFLHDVVEDTECTYEDLVKEFNQTIADLVEGVTKIGGIKFDSSAEKQAENFRKMLLSMAKDIRVVIIKLADRLNNMRTLEYMPERKIENKASETLEIYAPLAHRLGMGKIKWELEDLALKFLDKKAYNDIVRLVNRKRQERERLLAKVKRPIADLLKSNNIQATVEGRAKHFYSIYNKMTVQNKNFDEIYDLLALRIIVDKKEECYAALGLVHSQYTPLADRLKDYIGTPKNNGYRSLHTTVVALDQLVEIQIRTRDMHQEAEQGIAAHWNYKEGSIDLENDRLMNWIRQILQQLSEDGSPENLIDNLKADLYQDEVFIHSPRGELFKLPKGSTPLDFAFAIHSDLGLRTIGAKADGHIIPLKTELQNGQVIEIITSRNPMVNRDWLNFVLTSKARHAIRKALKEKEKLDSADLGKQMLDIVLQKNEVEIDDQNLTKFVHKQGFQDLRGFYSALGHDDISPKTILRKIKSFLQLEQEKHVANPLQNNFLSHARKDVNLRIEGYDNMMITFAKCCQPVPGDEILGYVTRGRGVAVHRTDCKNMVHLMSSSPKEKIVEVQWGLSKNHHFSVQLVVVAEDRLNLLNELTLAISRIKDVGLTMVNIRAKDGIATGFFMIEVRDVEQLNKVIRDMQKIDKVLSVERFDGHKTIL